LVSGRSGGTRGIGGSSCEGGRGRREGGAGTGNEARGGGGGGDTI